MHPINRCNIDLMNFVILIVNSIWIELKFLIY